MTNRPSESGQTPTRSPVIGLWLVAALVFLLLVPTQVYVGTPLWQRLPIDQVQAWAWTLALAAIAIVLGLGSARSRWSGIAAMIATAALTFGVGYVALRYVFEVPVSRVVALLSGTIALVAVAAPGMLGRWLGAATAVLVACTVAIVFGVSRSAPVPQDRIVATALHSFRVSEHAGLVDEPELPGGGFARLGDDLMLVTGSGEFYRLSWDNSGAIRSHRLALRAPLRQGWPDPEPEASRAARTGYLRTLDLTIDENVSPARLYLSHRAWDIDAHCYTARVSTIELPAADADGVWETIFDSSPCITPSYETMRGAMGGRLAWMDSTTLLLSLGDAGLAGPDGMEGPQDPASPYGKVLKLNRSGAYEVFTRGHRNVQGLSVGADGSVWNSEHGPQGGDEINYLVAGGNYGYPLATYGVQYGQDSWPLAAGRRDHGEFIEPALAFVPSIATSNLIHVGATGFPAWEGDLLLSSLRARNVTRIRTREGKVAYTEEIIDGYRIRDIEQTRDGRVVLWTDNSLVVELISVPARTDGEVAYGACAGCHGANQEGTDLGPELRGIVDRPVAAVPGFDYSPALRQLGGTWTPARLKAYVINPAGFAAGTTMNFPGVVDSLAFYIIEYLRPR